MPDPFEIIESDSPAPGLDAGRLSRPEEEAFRSIAAALGARFEGDLSSNARPEEPERSPDRSREHIGPAAAAAQPAGTEANSDGAPFERLLAPVPVPLLILRGDAVLFANRAALRLAGYTTTAALVAAGGAEALFRGAGRVGRGEIDLFTADGLAVPVAARLSAVPWHDGSALMLILETRETASRRSKAIENARVAIGRAREMAARAAHA